MTLQYPNLFSPAKINKLNLKNRIIMPPMIFGFGTNHGLETEKRIEVYARRARGGAAMLIVGPYFSERSTDVPTEALPRNLGPSPYWDENLRIHFMVEAIQSNGSLACASLSPTPSKWMNKALKEKMVGLSTDEWEQVLLETLDVCNGLDTSEIESNISEFVECARQIKALGFDAIEINFSFLPDYFSLSKFNKRTDKYHYDDEPEQRYRYHRELLIATRSALGPDFPIMTMWDIDSFRPEWRTLDDSIKMAPKIEEWGADSIRTRCGNSMDVQYDLPPQYFPIGHTAYLATAIKQVTKIPIIANGKLSDPDFAENIIANNEADLVSIGRALLADPELPNKWRSSRADRVRKCIYCCIGCYGNSVRYPTRGSRCTVNPLFGNEEKFGNIAPKDGVGKKVMIIGSGPAGMSAALTAAQKGCNVILCEKSAELGGGGEFKLSYSTPGKQENRYIVDYYKREFSELPNLKVRFNVDVDRDTVLHENPDTLIIATGSKPLVPEIPGVNSESVLTYEQILTSAELQGQQYIVIGGGQTGCETAHYLVEKGKQVKIIELLPKLAMHLNRATRNCLLDELEKGKVEQITNARVISITNNQVRYIKGNIEQEAQGDVIVLAVGSQSENSLYYKLLQEIQNIHIVGDAKSPRDIMHAIGEGFYTSYYLRA